MIVDLSHRIGHGTVTYPGLAAPRIDDYLSRADSAARYAEGTTFQIGRIEMIANTGTYLDTPFHRFEGGADLAALDLTRVADLDGLVVRCASWSQRAIDIDALAGSDVGSGDVGSGDVAGRAVLIHTGWSRHFGTPQYGTGHPFLTEAAAEHLAGAGVALVGIDSLNIDDTADLRRPAHTILLRAGIPIVEHMTGLDQLPDRGFRFFAVPPAVMGMGSFPVRAFGLLASSR